MLLQGLQIGGLWLTYCSGAYTSFYVLRYLQNKALGQQTLLDTLYAQLILLWIIGGFWTSIAFTLIVVGHQSWATTVIFGYGSFFVLLASVVHFALCGLIRLMMVVSPQTIQDIPDDNVKIFSW